MSRFIQLHLLTSYPPSNLNRDDLGRPKTAIVGGANRLRISSQSLKRAWRMSDIFECAVGGNRGTRTKRLGVECRAELMKKGVSEKNAKKWAAEIASRFGKLKKDSLEIEQLAHIAPIERRVVDTLLDTLATEDRPPESDELGLLRKDTKAVDMALFGRMLASSPDHNVEAAAQVAHAFTVHAAKVDDDYFTAVDDLNTHEEDAGAAHIGETGFSAGVFYLYVCINRDLLEDNLQGDTELSSKTLAALLETITKVSPTGKQNSFASRAYASYLLAETGAQQPRSMATAFLKPVQGQNQIVSAVEALESQRDNFDKIYGHCYDQCKTFNVIKGEGSFEEIAQFITERS